MGIEIVSATLFSVMMLLWNIYLIRQNSILVNKLMSRNYGEFVTADKFANNVEEEVKEEEFVDPYDQQKAREINSMLGMG